MIEHDLYARMALLSGHHAYDLRTTSASNAVFYSHTFPRRCWRVLEASGCLPPGGSNSAEHGWPTKPILRSTAAGLAGMDGRSLASISR